MHILIVEDEPQMAGLLARGLQEELYDVSLASDEKAALDLSSNRKFDVILLDVMLPKIGGLEVARQLRQRKQETPVLILTARDAFRDIVKGLDAGADDYLTKPFSFQELLARIRALGSVSGIPEKVCPGARRLGPGYDFLSCFPWRPRDLPLIHRVPPTRINGSQRWPERRAPIWSLSPSTQAAAGCTVSKLPISST
jgi:CheY-like chemotaxis protein